MPSATFNLNHAAYVMSQHFCFMLATFMMRASPRELRNMVFNFLLERPGMSALSRYDEDRSVVLTYDADERNLDVTWPDEYVPFIFPASPIRIPFFFAVYHVGKTFASEAIQLLFRNCNFILRGDKPGFMLENLLFGNFYGFHGIGVHKIRFLTLDFDLDDAIDLKHGQPPSNDLANPLNDLETKDFFGAVFYWMHGVFAIKALNQLTLNINIHSIHEPRMDKAEEILVPFVYRLKACGVKVKVHCASNPDPDDMEDDEEPREVWKGFDYSPATAQEWYIKNRKEYSSFDTCVWTARGPRE